MSAYATFRILAEQIAALGFDVLRLDYDGTGNSSGDYDEPDRAGAWLRSVALTIHEARRLTDRALSRWSAFAPGQSWRCAPPPKQVGSSGSSCGTRSPPDTPTCASSKPSRA